MSNPAPRVPVARRAGAFDSPGIRKVFDLAARLEDPINLSIGQPDFEMPAVARAAAREALEAGRNGYTPTQGIAPLRERLEERVRRETGQPDRRLCVTSGSSGALVLALMAILDPGDEVILLSCSTRRPIRPAWWPTPPRSATWPGWRRAAGSR